MGVGDIVFNGVGGAGATSSVSGFDLRISGNTAGTTALVSSGTLTLAGGSNITLSQSGNAITINGSTEGTSSMWYPAFQGGGVFQRYGQSSIHVDPIFCPGYVSATRAHIFVSLSNSSSSNSSYAGTLSYHMGIYTQNVSTMSLATSGSTNYQWTDTAGASASSLQGLKLLSIPIAANLTPGLYFFAYLSITNTANANWFTMSNVMHGMSVNSGSFAGASALTIQDIPGHGHWTAQTAALPSSILFADMRNSGHIEDIAYQMVSLISFTV